MMAWMIKLSLTMVALMSGCWLTQGNECPNPLAVQICRGNAVYGCNTDRRYYLVDDCNRVQPTRHNWTCSEVDAGQMACVRGDAGGSDGTE